MGGGEGMCGRGGKAVGAVWVVGGGVGGRAVSAGGGGGCGGGGGGRANCILL